MKYITKFFVYLMLCACITSIVSCGKMSDPKPIVGSGYPHTYPKY